MRAMLLTAAPTASKFNAESQGSTDSAPSQLTPGRCVHCSSSNEEENMKTIIQMTALGATVLLLAGCSGEPSNGDIEKAVQASVQQSQEAMGKLADGNPQAAEMAKAFQAKVHSVNKIGCKSDGDKAYKCDVELDMETGLTGRKKQTVPVRMVKGSDGWTMAGM